MSPMFLYERSRLAEIADKAFVYVFTRNVFVVFDRFKTYTANSPFEKDFACMNFVLIQGISLLLLLFIL